jgi:hypothetical protein
MSDDAAVREALQQQALLLREEFPNLEELRSVAKPAYDKQKRRPEMRFDSPMGTCRVWWEGSYWVILSPDEKMVYAPRKKLRDTLGSEVNRLKEETILAKMELQIIRLRDEYGDLEEFLSWARPLYDYEEERPELRFDTPVGICRVWWEEIRWVIRLPDGTIRYSQRGSLREDLRTTRQFLRKGII